MKIPAVLTVLTLACAATVAAPQYGSGSSDRDAAAGGNQSAAVSTEAQPKDAQGGGFLERTKHAFQRLGDKIRQATRKTTDRDETNAGAAKNDTRSMGAANSSNPQQQK